VADQECDGCYEYGGKLMTRESGDIVEQTRGLTVLLLSQRERSPLKAEETDM